MSQMSVILIYVIGLVVLFTLLCVYTYFTGELFEPAVVLIFLWPATVPFAIFIGVPAIIWIGMDLLLKHLQNLHIERKHRVRRSPDMDYLQKQALQELEAELERTS